VPWLLWRIQHRIVHLRWIVGPYRTFHKMLTARTCSIYVVFADYTANRLEFLTQLGWP
jgi:hypothetical protein